MDNNITTTTTGADRMAHDLHEAVYAINRILGYFADMPDRLAALTAARDEVWTTGQIMGFDSFTD